MAKGYPSESEVIDKLESASPRERFSYLIKRGLLVGGIFWLTAVAFSAIYMTTQFRERELQALRQAELAQRTVELMRLLDTAANSLNILRSDTDPADKAIALQTALSTINTARSILGSFQERSELQRQGSAFSLVTSAHAEPRERRTPPDLTNVATIMWVILFLPLIFAAIGVYFVVNGSNKDAIRMGLDSIKYIMGFYVGAASTFFGVSLS